MHNDLNTNTIFHFRQIIRHGIMVCSHYHLLRINRPLQLLRHTIKSKGMYIKMIKCKMTKLLQVQKMQNNAKNMAVSDLFLCCLAEKAIVRQVIHYAPCYVWTTLLVITIPYLPRSAIMHIANQFSKLNVLTSKS